MPTGRHGRPPACWPTSGGDSRRWRAAAGPSHCRRRRSTRPRCCGRGSGRCRSRSSRSQVAGRRPGRSPRSSSGSVWAADGAGIRQIVGECRVDSDVRILAVVVATIAAAATAPAVITGPAEGLTTSSARLSATVNPGGAATTYHFEYGTTAAYGLATTVRDAGTGDAPVTVHATLAGLTADTDYHYRIVAENAAGAVMGSDAVLRTGAKPRPPGAATGVARPVGATSTTLHGTVEPRGAPTDYHFEYGTTLAYEQSTPTVSAGAEGLVRMSVPIAGLRPSTRYHVRLVAVNAAGRTAAADRPFTTLRQPTGLSIAVTPAHPVWGSPVRVAGTVSGAGIAHIPVALERLDFPCTSGFVQSGLPAKADGSGRFTFTLPFISTTTRLRASTRTRILVASAPLTVPVALKVGLGIRRIRNQRAQLSGAVWPAVPHGRAQLQRQRRRGVWITVARRGLQALTRNRSRFRFRVRLRRDPRTYRVRVSARDGGAHFPGTSRARRSPPRNR